MRGAVISGISHRFRWLSPSEGQITHVLLTRSPLEYPQRGLSARLACVKHAASVRPEPGSNSPLNSSDVTRAEARMGHRLLGVSRQELLARHGRVRVLPKGIIDRYRSATNRFPQPADWRYKLIRRLLAHC